MDPTVLMILTIVVLMVVISRSLERVRKRENPIVGKAERIADFKKASEKLVSTINMFQLDLDPSKLAAGREHFTHYYCAYLHEIGKAISRHDQVEFDVAFRAPILREVTRLCATDDKNIKTGDSLIDKILTTPIGEQGCEDGKIDAAQALDSNYTGPYWQRLEKHFDQDSQEG
ncbi:MAG: hypothetical protein OEU36_05775 [Gammaproteobacteria bacterium]|nr:hypothetical protein [Gammaproteobacteria bacterium]